VLAQRPDLDPILDGGDTLHIPKKPTYVLALGDVSNPGAVQFQPGKSVSEYVSEVGGTQSTADDGRVFLVLPNGSAQPVRSSFWRRSNVVVPPGSTIIVPKNLQPLRTLGIVRDVATIFGQLATAVASVAILADRNN
jgi:polysaccharide biosynthesis/export protein